MAELVLRAGRQRIAKDRLKATASPLRAPMLGSSGGWLLVHRSTRKPGWWQATSFDASDEPWGDSESQDFARLLDHAHGLGIDWLKAERVG